MIFDFFLNSINIHVLKLVLNFQILTKKISIFITQLPQKDVKFSKLWKV